MEHVGLLKKQWTFVMRASGETSVDQQKLKDAETKDLPPTQPFEYVCVKEEQAEGDSVANPVAPEALHVEDRGSVLERSPDPATDDHDVPVEGTAFHAETPGYLTEDSNYTTLPEESEGDGNHIWDSNCSESVSRFPRLRIAVKRKRCSRTGETSHSCSQCGKSYPKPCQLRYHMRKHTGERPYICGICGKTFAKTAHLNVHTRTHTGEKPFKCEICGKAFSDSGKQKRHMRSHAGDRPYVCDICGKCYTVIGSLTSHKRSHTGDNLHKCDICSKTFPRPSVLKVHMRTHTGEKPHECGVCGKGFTQFGNLKRHLHSHIMGNRLRNVMVSTAE